MTARPKHWQGHLAMLIANMAWGAMPPLTKDILLSGTITPVALSTIRIAGGAILFWLFSLILPDRITGQEKVSNRDWPKLLLASVLMISANQGLFIIGIGYTSPIDSSVMSALTPILTMIFAAILIGAPITAMKTIGVAIGLSGAILMVTADSTGSEAATNPILGDCLCLGAQLCAALYYVLFVKIINRYSPFTMMKWMFTFAALTYVPCTLPWLADVTVSDITPVIWTELAYIIVFATFISYMLIPFSQRYLKPTTMAMYNYLQPATAALLATIMGVADFGLLKIAATLLIFAGVWFVTRSSDTAVPPKTAKQH